METINLIFLAAIVGLFVTNVQTPEIRRGKAVFGSGTLTKPRNRSTVEAYLGVRENVDQLRRYFYWRNVVKLLFCAYCCAAAVYILLLVLALVEISPVVPAHPIGKGEVPVTVDINAPGTPYHENQYELGSYVVVAQSPEKVIEAFFVTVPEREGQLVWLSGNGKMNEINIGTGLQVFGVISIFLGIATFAVCTVLQDND